MYELKEKKPEEPTRFHVAGSEKLCHGVSLFRITVEAAESR
jgi:hypothetical protein